MKDKKVKLTAIEDIPHLTYKALSVLNKYDIGLTWMEVYAYVAYIKLRPIDDDVWQKVKDEWMDIGGWESLEEIDLFPFEEKDTEMKNVLDIIPHGVTLLNKKGDIKYANNYATERVFTSGGKDITGVNISKFIDYSKLNLSLKNNKSKKPMVKEKIEIGNQLYQVNLQLIKN